MYRKSVKLGCTDPSSEVFTEILGSAVRYRYNFPEAALRGLYGRLWEHG